MDTSQRRGPKTSGEGGEIPVGGVDEASGASGMSGMSGARDAPEGVGGRAEERYWIITGVAGDVAVVGEAERHAPRDPRSTSALAVRGRLAVFSFREDAEVFLGVRGEGGWRVEGFSAGELASSLYGPLSVFGSVALDPIPQTRDGSVVDGLLKITRKEFIWMISGADLRG